MKAFVAVELLDWKKAVLMRMCFFVDVIQEILYMVFDRSLFSKP
jgi:hypothetical protein